MRVHRPPAARKLRIDVIICGLLFWVCIWFSWQSSFGHIFGSSVHQEVKVPISTPDDSHKQHLGAVVLLAPARDEVTWWANISRFCFLMRAVRSVDQHLNQHYGPYPIFILVAKDYTVSDNSKDGPYTERDRALITSWAPNSQVIFQEINLYSDDALEPGATVEQDQEVEKRRRRCCGRSQLGVSIHVSTVVGSVQASDFLQDYKYYMRMDDDSLLTEKLPFDPFQEMQKKGLDYVWRRDSMEAWGITKLKELIEKHITISPGTPFIGKGKYHKGVYTKGEYRGGEPYNNFHISRVSFWSEPQWLAFWKDLNDEHAFFKHRLGDANVHAAATMMLDQQRFARWHFFPYVHNSNDMSTWGQTSWRLECEAAEQSFQTETTSR